MKIDIIDCDGKTMYATIEEATATQTTAYATAMEIRLEGRVLHVVNVILYHEDQILHVEVSPK